MFPRIRRALGPAQLQAAIFGSGGADSNRHLGGHIPALCRLSYAPGVEPPVGFDPTHSRLRDGCSASLSYGSVVAGAGFEPASGGL